MADQVGKEDKGANEDIRRITEDIRRMVLPPLQIGGERKIIYGSRSAKPGKFRLPRGVVVSPSKEIFVVDQGNRVMQVHNTDGLYLRHFPTLVPGAKDMEPHDVSMDGNGTLWVVGGGELVEHVVQYSTDGTAMTQFDLQNSWPYRGIAVDMRNNHILVTDGLQHQVHVFRPDSSLVRTFKHSLQGAEMSYITVDEKGNILVTDYIDHTIYRFDKFGKFLMKFGGEGSGEGQLKYPCGVYTDGWAHNVVADSGNNRLQIFTYDGQFIRSIFTGFSVDGVAVGPEKQLVLTSQLSHSVHILPTYQYLKGCPCVKCNKEDWISMILFPFFGKDDNEAWVSMILFLLFGKDYE